MQQTARDLVTDHRPERAKHGMGQIGVLCHRGIFVDQPAKLMNADPEMPFLLPTPRLIKLALKSRTRQNRRKFGLKRLCARPRRKETPIQHRIKHACVARQV